MLPVKVHTLRFKINLSILQICLIIALVYLFVLFLFETQRREKQIERSRVLIQAVADRTRNDMANAVLLKQRDALRNTLQNILLLKDFVNVSVYGILGEPLLDRSNTDPLSLEVLSMLQKGPFFLEQKRNDQSVLSYYFNLRAAGEVLACVQVDYSLTEIQQESRFTIGLLAAMLMVALGSISILLRVMIYRHVLQPVWELGEAMKQVRSGRYGEQINVTAKDEIAELAGSFNHMSAALKTSVAQLRASNHDLLKAVWAAEEANQTKVRFLANMSHELRTPMNAIIGYSELLMEEAKMRQQDPLANDLRRILDAGQHLLQLINNILDFSRIESGQLKVEAAEFGVPGLVEDILVSVKARALEKNLALHAEFAPGTPATMNGDAIRLRQVLVNLIDNAIKFTEQGSITVRVRAERSEALDATIQFEVEDTGIGISPDQQAKIFQAFEQSDTSYTRRYEGTGLGLTLCRSLVRLMQGRLWVESKPGQGSKFCFSLPQNKITMAVHQSMVSGVKRN